METEASCNAHTKGDGSWWENDARGIPLTRVCSKCRSEKLKKYRPEVLTNSNYEADEPIESEPEVSYSWSEADDYRYEGDEYQ